MSSDSWRKVRCQANSLRQSLWIYQYPQVEVVNESLTGFMTLSMTMTDKMNWDFSLSEIFGLYVLVLATEVPIRRWRRKLVCLSMSYVKTRMSLNWKKPVRPINHAHDEMVNVNGKEADELCHKRRKGMNSYWKVSIKDRCQVGLGWPVRLYDL